MHEVNIRNRSVNVYVQFKYVVDTEKEYRNMTTFVVDIRFIKYLLDLVRLLN